jgi:hypothetical protein
MASLDNPMEGRRGPRAPSAGKPASQGKGMEPSPTHGGVARPKAAVGVVVQGRVPGDGGAVLHDDYGGNRMKQGKDHIGKPITRHLTRFDLVLLCRSLFSLRTLVEQC